MSVTLLRKGGENLPYTINAEAPRSLCDCMIKALVGTRVWDRIGEMILYLRKWYLHYRGDNMKWHTSVPSCICISIVMSLGEVLTSCTGERSGATVIQTHEQWPFTNPTPWIPQLEGAPLSNLQAVKHTIKIKAENLRVMPSLVKSSLKLVMFLLNWSFMSQTYSSEYTFQVSPLICTDLRDDKKIGKIRGEFHCLHLSVYWLAVYIGCYATLVRIFKGT